MRILMTGATGFLGKLLARTLADGGHRVTCFVRPTSSRAGLTHDRISFTVGDVTDRDSVRAAVGETYDAVVHTAALVKSWVRRPAQFHEVNVDGFRHVVQGALDAGVPRILYTSSFFALGPTDGYVGDETTHHEGVRFCHEYERTKYLADCEAVRLMAEGAPLITVYPGVIYGPGDLTEGNIVAALLLDFMRRQPWLLRKMPGVLGTGRQLWNYAHVADVVRGHVAALETGALGERYVLGGENVSMMDFQRLMGEATGLEPFTMRLPFAAGWLAGWGEEVAARLWGRQAFNTRGTVQIFRHDWAYSSEKAAAQLDYAYRPLADGMRETVEWIQKRELVTRRRSR